MSTVSPAVKIGLRLLGMWPDVSYSTTYWLSFMLSMLVIQYFQYLYIFEHLSMSELSNLVDGLPMTLDYSLTFFKLTSLWIQRRVFHQILTAMDNDWRECINMDKHLYMMTIKANIAHFISNVLLSVNATVALLYLSGDYIIRFVFLNEAQNHTLRQFPIKIQFPFETQQSPMFELLVVTISLHVMLHVSVLCILNGLVLTLVTIYTILYFIFLSQTIVTIFILLRFQYCIRMIVTSTVSPVLKIGLQLLGVWPDVSIPYWLIYICSILIIQYFQYRYVYEHFKISELSNLVDSLPASLDYSLTIFKIIILWIHRRVVYQLLAAMDNDWHECVDIDQHLYVMTIKANTSHFYANAMISVYIIVGVFYLLSGYVVHFVYEVEDYNNTLREFPIKVYFPFENQQSPIFELLALTLFLHVLLNTTTVSIVNALISTLSKSIADAAYESFWYDLPLNQRKILMFVIMRSQKQLMITAGRITSLSLTTFTSYYQYRYVLEHSKISELSDFVDGLSAALSFSLIILKVTSIWIHRGVLHQLLAAMDNDWHECVDSDQHLYVMTIKANISHFYSNVMISINILAAVTYFSGGYAIRFVYQSGDYNNTLRQFPVKVLFPLKAQQSPLFELLAVTQFLLMLFNSYMLSVINALISTLVLHVSGQIDILCQEFKTISAKTLPYKTFTSMLGILIERHNRVFWFSDNIENLFSFIALMQVIWNTLVICGLVFIIIISFHIETGLSVIIKSVFSYLAVIAEIFILCFAGEYLNLKSKSIADAAYESLWYDLSSNNKKTIPFIILRSHKQLVITAGKITNLSLETFTSYFQYRYVFEHFKISELSNLVDSLPAALDYSLTIFKVTSLWIHRRVIHQLLTAMDKDWRECVNIDHHLYVMTIKANTSHFCSNIMFGINTIASVSYLLSGYAIRFVYLSGDYNDTLRQLPIKVQFPFETQQSPIFELLVVILLLHVMLNSCTLSILNALISTLVFHVSGQIDILCQEFKNLSAKILPYKTSTSTLAILIERHNRIFLFSDKIEKLFSFIALMQVIWNTFIICSLGFIIIISLYVETGVITIIKTIFTYLAVIVEVFILCFAGEYLNFKYFQYQYVFEHFKISELSNLVDSLPAALDYSLTMIKVVTLWIHRRKSIINAAYELSWYDIPSHQSKMLILIIMRSQKQLTISAGKMMDLSFETYTNVIKKFEFSNLIDGLSLTLDYSLTFVKLASLWIHRRVFHKILAAMDNDWRECINIDEHLNMMTIKATVSHFYSNAMLSFNGAAAVLYVLGDYAIRFVYTAKDYNDTLRQLPIKVLLPFETEQSPIFELLVVIMFLHIILVSLLVAVLNGLILLINTLAAAFYAIESLIRFAKDENDPHESKFDLLLKMKLLFKVNEPPSLRLWQDPGVSSPSLLWF
ncbi:Putative odorant receptor 22c [Trachymyrmex cornetzi]|uniref:Putative odorant receptor 22c n=1 Tax=Trachymyrmex cornetzi TaxID=471704 RepID=A0A195E016_9HYME|nr:Putative odorant receptor 22c [Trachymyrmex cornetzi]